MVLFIYVYVYVYVYAYAYIHVYIYIYIYSTSFFFTCMHADNTYYIYSVQGSDCVNIDLINQHPILHLHRSHLNQ